MATYNSLVHTNGVPLPGPVGFGARLVAIDSQTITVSSAITSADAGTCFTPPKGFCALMTFIEASDMDTNGSPTLTIDVGTADDADRFVAASTVAQAGTGTSAVLTAGLAYVFDGATAVLWARQAGPATGAAGTLRVIMVGFYVGTAFS